MVSRENTVIAAFLVVAIVAAAVVDTYAAVPSWTSLVVLFGLGVLVPTAVNEYLDRQADR